jgi:hypothetical protein
LRPLATAKYRSWLQQHGVCSAVAKFSLSA